MTPQCQNCGSHVSKNYARVFCRPQDDAPRVCPNCDDLIRGNDNKPREARSTRRQ